MTLTDTQRASLGMLAHRVREHFQAIEQDAPDGSFVVGGAVRDAVLGLESKDLDFVVTGETAETMEARGFEPIEASSFPVFHDEYHQEWALARTEEKDGYGYDGFEVFTDDVSLREDLQRRDLTTNSMALDVRDDAGAVTTSAQFTDAGEGWGLIDPHDGVDDLNDGVLRHVSDAFADDPLRVLRVARYAGRFAVPTDEEIFEYVENSDGSYEEHYHQFASQGEVVVESGFRVADETIEIMRQVAPELNRMSRDRIGSELRTAMAQARRPSRVFDVLMESGALAVLWPELDRAEIVEAGPDEYHMEGSVFSHSMMVLDRMERLCREHDIDGHDRVRRLFMALGHDIGKVTVADQKGGLHSDDPPVRFPDHASVGASVLEDSCRRLGLDSEIQSVMADGADLHMRFHDLIHMSVAESLDFLTDHFPTGSAGRAGDGMGLRELPTNDEGEPFSFYGATAWELLDLAHADHEGRLEQTSVDEVRGTDLKRRTCKRPEFDREPFEQRIEAVFRASSEVEGYEALEQGLCGTHDPSDEDVEIDRSTGTLHMYGHAGPGSEGSRSVQAVMSECPDCRTPDEWIGDQLREMKIDLVRDEIIGGSG